MTIGKGKINYFSKLDIWNFKWTKFLLIVPHAILVFPPWDCYFLKYLSKHDQLFFEIFIQVRSTHCLIGVFFVGIAFPMLKIQSLLSF